MTRNLFGALALLAMTAAPAMAADMAVKAPPMAPAYNWSGWYVGINGGGSGGWADTSAANIGPDAFFAVANRAAVVRGGSPAFSQSGALAGGQIGYLAQFQNAIVGVEAAIDWTNVKGSASFGPTPYPVTPGSTFAWNVSTKATYLATFLGRVGYNLGSWYPYVTGGAALSHFTYSANFLDTFYPTNNTFSFSKDMVGWALGAGAEWRVSGNWMLRAEYLHLDFGSLGGNGTIACTPGVGNCALGGNTVPFNFNAKLRQDLGRVALSYHM